MSEENFAQEFERLLNEDNSELKPGAIVKGIVTNIGREYVTVDIGFKSEGIIPKPQFQDYEGKLLNAEGDEIDVMIITLENDDGEIVLSKERADQYRVWKEVEQKFADGEMVSGRVVQKVKGGLQVDIGIPAFLPGSQIDVRPHRNLDKFLGEHMDLKVLKISRDKGNIVVSRRAVLVAERDELRGETLKVLSEGVVLEGIVKNITDYGAFIDLGGIDGLLHITDISWGRVTHPSEKLSVGDKVPVVVIKYDQENQRVSLGMKQLKEDPWANVEERYPLNIRVSGAVINLTDYGAFIELEEGVDGLIHVTDMTWSKKVKHPSKILGMGDKVEAVVLGIDAADKKISLGLKQTQANPWENFMLEYPKGTKVKGTVKSIMEFGIFVEVADDIDGLVHVSDFSWTKRIKDPSEIKDFYKKGDEVEALVLDVDTDNERLSLGVKQLSEDPWEEIIHRYPVGSKVKGKITSLADFGVFVEIEEGVEGLIHLSHLGIKKGDNHREVEAFQPGQEIESEVTSIDNEERRISLSIRAIHERESGGSDGSFSDYVEDSPFTIGELIKGQMGQD